MGAMSSLSFSYEQLYNVAISCEEDSISWIMPSTMPFNIELSSLCNNNISILMFPDGPGPSKIVKGLK